MTIWQTGDDPNSALDLNPGAAYITDSEVVEAATQLNEAEYNIEAHTQADIVIAAVNPQAFELMENS